MTSKVEEFALARLTSTMGRAEASEMREAMRKAVDDKLMADIVADNRHSVFLPAGQGSKVTPAGAGKVIDGAQQGHGWAEPKSIDNWRPDGLAVMDAMMDQQDAIDRAARARELAEAAHINKQLKSKS
jgi:hypothetical protein